jgi:hypothetical protein
MELAGVPSWRIVIDEPSDLHQLLFIREAFELSGPDPRFPGTLEPKPLDLSHLISDEDRARFQASFNNWWGRTLDNHRSTSSTISDPKEGMKRMRRWSVYAGGFHFAYTPESKLLQQALKAGFSEFRQWWSPPGTIESQPSLPPYIPGVKGRLIGLHLGGRAIRDAVREVEEELGRRSLPFEFNIETLAVTGPTIILQDHHYALVSGHLMADEEHFHRWLVRQLRAIA